MKCPYCIKVCTKCGEILVANNMNYSKKKTGKYGLRGECKKCVSQYKKEYRQNNADKIKEYQKEYRQNNAEQIKEQYKEYYKNNVDKIKERNKEYRQDNADKIKEYKKEYRQNNADKIKEQQKEYRQSHKEQRTEYDKQYRLNNPEKIFNQHNKRRQRKESQGMGITKEQWLDMMKYFDWKCAYSGKPLKDNNRTIDHVKPLVKGGLNEIFNCVPCDRSINSSKNSKDLTEWYKEQEFYDESKLQKIYEWQQHCLEIYYEYIKIS